eukprot:TRINITY_DN5491_c0_g1_i16.p1 TRINITY_DN5491_c0_g1~~TRINITY_DN5491_c0_g1_i16.p1  ORF type:complete len:181 (-),score=33.27 TRINITY_DN5491_c0_g1_i16:226-768(-)
MEVIDCPVLSQHFPSVKLTSMCTLVALAVALQGGKICSLDLNEGVDLALKLGITSPIEGGISAAGCVRLAMEFGNPAFGALGENATAVEGQRLIKKHLKLGAPVVVMTTANLDPSGCGHAQCIVVQLYPGDRPLKNILWEIPDGPPGLVSFWFPGKSLTGHGIPLIIIYRSQMRCGTQKV